MSIPSQPSDPEEPASDEDAAWRAIVANYGDRPEIEDLPVAEAAETPEGQDSGPGAGSRSDPPPEPEERFVPPPPPPLPAPPPGRLLAWTGLFGVPFLVLLALMTKLPVPSWFGLILMAWFVGGFVFLVASMGSGSGEDPDDGARL